MGYISTTVIIWRGLAECEDGVQRYGEGSQHHHLARDPEGNLDADPGSWALGRFGTDLGRTEQGLGRDLEVGRRKVWFEIL